MILQYLCVGVAAFGAVLAGLAKGVSKRLYLTFTVCAALCLPISTLSNLGYTFVASILLSLNLLFMLLTSSGKI